MARDTHDILRVPLLFSSTGNDVVPIWKRAATFPCQKGTGKALYFFLCVCMEDTLTHTHKMLYRGKRGKRKRESIDEDSRRTRPPGGEEAPLPPIPPLPRIGRDADGRVVYVDLRPLVATSAHVSLVKRLRQLQPTDKQLSRLSPINRQRVLYEVDPGETVRTWLVKATQNLNVGQALRTLFEPLTAFDNKLRLVGAQFIVPKVTQYDRRRVPAQVPHQDIATQGEVIAIAVHLQHKPLGTHVYPTAVLQSDGLPVGKSGFGRAETPCFAYDVSTVHAGAGIEDVDGPYPRFFKERVFLLFCSSALSKERVAAHRKDNGLCVRPSTELLVDVARPQVLYFEPSSDEDEEEEATEAPNVGEAATAEEAGASSKLSKSNVL